MDNETIARTLLELADVFELTGEVPFKVRAFRTAARAIEGLGEPVGEKVKSGTLQKIPGVGEGMMRRLHELVATGALAELEARKKALPPGLIELMNIPGMGIKTAQQVWKERGIADVDALERAAREGKLRDLPRFGE